MSNRNVLKSYFITNAVPKQSDFADLIDSAFIQSEDGIRKTGQQPLSLQAADNGEQHVLHFYKSFNDSQPAWKLSLQSLKPGAGGLNIGSAAAPNALFIDEETGNVGIGVSKPNRPLSIKGKGGNNELLSFVEGKGTTRWHINMPENGNDLNFVESGIADNRLYLKAGGNVGIGTNNPKAKLDIGIITKGQLGAVLGRLAEGNDVGEGTFLGVRGQVTQPDTDNVVGNMKSFSIEHSFYGGVNNSINFFRGNETTGGFLTFNTENNTERVRIDAKGNVGIGVSNPVNKLEVNGATHTDGNPIYFRKNTQDKYDFIRWDKDADELILAGFRGVSLGYTEGTGGDIMLRTLTVKNGNVGIGTNDPKAKLHVEGNFAFKMDGIKYKYYNKDNPGGPQTGTGTAPTSIYASSKIIAEELYAFSDKRIKKDAVINDTLQSLQQISEIQIKDFLYQDEIQHGNTIHKGVIAQELETVFPESVNTTTDFVPDIYAIPQTVTISNGVLNLTMKDPHGLTTGDTARLITTTGSREVKVKKESDLNFSVENWIDESTEIFVYGKQVHDFRTVNYNSIFCLGISAIQELHKQLHAVKEEVKSLKEKIVADYVAAV